MRRLTIGIAVAVATAITPFLVVAGNQERAERIALAIRNNGQLQNYKIGVRFQDGTVWLKGQVDSREQMNATLKLAFQAPGVQRVVNNLQIGAEQQVATSLPAKPAPRASVSAALVPPVSVPASPVIPASVPTAATVRGPAPAASVVPAQVMRPLQHASGALTGEPLFRPAVVARPKSPMHSTKTDSHSVKLLQRAVESARSQKHSVQIEPSKAPGQGDNATASVPTPTAAQQASIKGEKGPTPAPLRAFAASKPATPATQPTSIAVMPGLPIPAAFLQMAPPMFMAQAPGAPMPIGQQGGAPVPQYITPVGGGASPARYDQPHLPDYSWPSYAAHPNYASLTYPKQYSPTAWPYIGPFYPYPQVPLGWRKITLEWHDGWWQLDFCDNTKKDWFSGLFRPPKTR